MESIKLTNTKETEQFGDESGLKNRIKELQFKNWELENSLKRIMETHKCSRNSQVLFEKDKGGEVTAYRKMCMICGEMLDQE